MGNKCSQCQFENLGGKDVRWVWITEPITGIHYKTDVLCFGHREIYRELGFNVLAGGYRGRGFK